MSNIPAVSLYTYGCRTHESNPIQSNRALHFRNPLSDHIPKSWAFKHLPPTPRYKLDFRRLEKCDNRCYNHLLCRRLNGIGSTIKINMKVEIKEKSKFVYSCTVYSLITNNNGTAKLAALAHHTFPSPSFFAQVIRRKGVCETRCFWRGRKVWDFFSNSIYLLLISLTTTAASLYTYGCLTNQIQSHHTLHFRNHLTPSDHIPKLSSRTSASGIETFLYFRRLETFDNRCDN